MGRAIVGVECQRTTICCERLFVLHADTERVTLDGPSQHIIGVKTQGEINSDKTVVNPKLGDVHVGFPQFRPSIGVAWVELRGLLQEGTFLGIFLLVVQRFPFHHQIIHGLNWLGSGANCC
jgi:hypothetical protein